MGGIYEVAVEMASGATIYMPSFLKSGSGVQELLRGREDSQSCRQHGDLIRLLLFFENMENMQKVPSAGNRTPMFRLTGGDINCNMIMKCELGLFYVAKQLERVASNK
jgi:hypothetical protein